MKCYRVGGAAAAAAAAVVRHFQSEELELAKSARVRKDDVFQHINTKNEKKKSNLKGIQAWKCDSRSRFKVT